MSYVMAEEGMTSSLYGDVRGIFRKEVNIELSFEDEEREWPW